MIANKEYITKKLQDSFKNNSAISIKVKSANLKEASNFSKVINSNKVNLRKLIIK